MLNHLFTLGLGETSLLCDYLTEQCINFAGHVGCITTDVEICLLFEKLVDLGGLFLHLMLDVDLLWPVAGEGNVNLESIAEVFLVLLKTKILALKPTILN
jgi:hypothetical protein